MYVFVYIYMYIYIYIPLYILGVRRHRMGGAGGGGALPQPTKNEMCVHKSVNRCHNRGRGWCGGPWAGRQPSRGSRWCFALARHDLSEPRSPYDPFTFVLGWPMPRRGLVQYVFGYGARGPGVVMWAGRGGAPRQYGRTHILLGG